VEQGWVFATAKSIFVRTVGKTGKNHGKTGKNSKLAIYV